MAWLTRSRFITLSYKNVNASKHFLCHDGTLQVPDNASPRRKSWWQPGLRMPRPCVWDLWLSLKWRNRCFLLVVTPCVVGTAQHFGEKYCFHLHVSPEEGDSMFLRNVGTHLQANTASWPRRSIQKCPCVCPVAYPRFHFKTEAFSCLLTRTKLCSLSRRNCYRFYCLHGLCIMMPKWASVLCLQNLSTLRPVGL
jgi:hypothetical protein